MGVEDEDERVSSHLANEGESVDTYILMIVYEEACWKIDMGFPMSACRHCLLTAGEKLG